MRASTTFEEFASVRGLCIVKATGSAEAAQEFIYSKDRLKRYAYSEIWNPDMESIGKLGALGDAHPGTGETELRRRNALERCKKWSRSWGHGGLLFGNVFSLRTKSAKELLAYPHEVDQTNLEALHMLCSLAGDTIVAWGNSARKVFPADTVLPILGEAKCLGHTKQGRQPRHPLYVKDSVTPEVWIPDAPASRYA